MSPTYRRGGFTVHAHKDRIPKGKDDPIERVPAIIACVQGRGAYNGLGCGACVNFEACKPVVGVSRDTDYCHFRPSRFISKTSLYLTKEGPK